MDLRNRLWPGIPETKWSDPEWQLENRLKGQKGLARFLEPFGETEGPYLNCLEQYKWAATPYYISLIKRHYAEDPIGRQVIPSPKELSVSSPHSREDPLQEKRYSPLPGLIHRYRDRALVLVSNFCASYCRHCNRKRTWKKPECVPRGQKAWEDIKAYIRTHPDIREVLVSGGDPLLLPAAKLEYILDLLKSIPNVKVLRIGSRLPVVLPMAVTDKLCRILRSRRPLWLNTHFNHPHEITPEAKDACDRLQLAGIPVSNQSVLLRGVNDEFAIMKKLCCRLQEIMVRPYYLFHCDFVKGTDHFRTEIKHGIDIIDKMWGDTGGMCIPRYVVDLPDGMGKARVMPPHLKGLREGTALFQSFQGKFVNIKTG